ncbi:MAG: hypothetical protein U1E17_01025 [Geminicoccaceae bacterium]
MYTSRAEYRLTLRAGQCRSAPDRARHRRRQRQAAALRPGSRRGARRWKPVLDLLTSLALTPKQAAARAARRRGRRAAPGLELLAHPDVTLAQPLRHLAGAGRPAGRCRRATRDRGPLRRLRRQAADIAVFRREEGFVLPTGLDFAAMSGLTTELRQALGRVRPTTLGAAALSGMTPAAQPLYRHARETRLSQCGP